MDLENIMLCKKNSDRRSQQPSDVTYMGDIKPNVKNEQARQANKQKLIDTRQQYGGYQREG